MFRHAYVLLITLATTLIAVLLFRLTGPWLISITKQATISVFTPVLCFAGGLLIACTLTFAWKILGGLRYRITGKSDVLEDEMRTFPADFGGWLKLGIGIVAVFLGISVGSFFSSNSVFAAESISAFSCLLGFLPFFPLLYLKRRIIARARR